MAIVDGFFDLPTKARNDPLGHGFINTATANEALLTRWFGAEHLLTNTNGQLGEHNAREIPRSAAAVTATGGPPATSYSINCPDGYLTFTDTTEAGVMRLALAAGQGTAGKMVVQLQDYTESGATVGPTMLWAKIVSATEIWVYSANLFYDLVPPTFAELWLPVRTHFGILVYSEPVEDGDLSGSLPAAAVRNYSLRGPSMWSRLAQRDGDLRHLISRYHDADTGAHDDFRVAKAMGHVTWNGLAYVLDTANSVGVASVTTVGAGVVQVTLTTNTGGPLWRPFVTADYARSDGGLSEDIFTASCPLNLLDVDNFTVHLFKHTDGASPYEWLPGDTDFWFTAHAE